MDLDEVGEADLKDLRKVLQQMTQPPLECSGALLWRALLAAFENEYQTGSATGPEEDLPRLPIREEVFHQFLVEKDLPLDQAEFRILWRFANRTRIGRALANPGPTSFRTSPIDLLIDQFDNAVNNSGNIDYTGWYFLYHGSYIQRGSFAVHLLNISHNGDGILSVRDVIRDIAGGRQDHTIYSDGCASIVYDAPHIVLFSNQAHENRDGFSLFVGSQRHRADKGRFKFAIGTTAGMTSGHESYSRAALLIRAEQVSGKAPPTWLTTGTFPIDQLPTDWPHRESLIFLRGEYERSNLADAQPFGLGLSGLVFEDPINDLIGMSMSAQ